MAKRKVMLTEATDRQLILELKRREHISTNALLGLLLPRFDAAIFAGLQVEAANRFAYTIEAKDDSREEYEMLSEWLYARLDEGIPGGSETGEGEQNDGGAEEAPE